MAKFTKIAALALPVCAAMAMAQPLSAANNAAVSTAVMSAAAPEQKAREKSSASKRYCFNFKQDTGTRLTRRACKTRSQWEDEGVNVAEIK
jgi:hypothetical protein